MASTPKTKSISVDNASTNVDSQDPFVVEMAARVRERASRAGMSQSELADDLGISRKSMTNYWKGRRPYPMASVPRLAERLDTNVDWLLTGDTSRRNGLVTIDDAAFVGLPRYDLRELTENSKGNRVETVPIRRDWLARRVNSVSGLWLTELPADGPKGLIEGDVVICSDVARGGIQDGWICLFRSDTTGIFVARYTFREVQEGDITPSFVAEHEAIAIARVHARLLAKI